MSPVLFHIYGPLSIQAYGLCIAIGGLISFYLLCKDSKIQRIVSESTLITSFQLIILSGYFGGRIGTMLSEPTTFKDPLFLFKFWEPGLSILGAIIGIIATLYCYFYIKKIPTLLFLDRVAIYAPLTQSFGRLGCFFAGCCYGLPTTSWLSVTYTNTDSMAPLHHALHPAQLYSSLLLLAIFFFLYLVQQHRSNKPGILFLSYIVLASIERFLIDFIRWDRIFTVQSPILQLYSIHQWIALAMACIATIGICIIHNRKQ